MKDLVRNVILCWKSYHGDRYSFDYDERYWTIKWNISVFQSYLKLSLLLQTTIILHFDGIVIEISNQIEE